MWPWLSCHYCCYCCTKQHPSKSHKTVSHSAIIISTLTQYVAANGDTNAIPKIMTINLAIGKLADIDGSDWFVIGVTQGGSVLLGLL